MTSLRSILTIGLLTLGIGGVLVMLGFWRCHARGVIRPEALVYPVLLVNDTNIAEVCLTEDELTLRPENTDHIIEQHFHVVDAQGRRYRIENFHSVEKRPSTISRVFRATVYNVNRFRVAFNLRLERALTRDEVLAQLNDRTWVEAPAAPGSATLGEMFVAYRIDRFREFGNARDRMPEPREGAASLNPRNP